jgi:ankyrin repeat protein
VPTSKAARQADRDLVSGPTTRTRASKEEVVMDVEQLRKQAKDLVKAARAGDAAALERLDGREPILARAQLVVAREQGYPSWPALVDAAEANVQSFAQAATQGRRERAARLLAARPELERDPWVRLVLGREWQCDPRAPGGPLGWAPLLYACHSAFDTTAVARDLLARGADPNGFFVNEYGRMSALYGAAGVKHDPELTRALLRAGADPDDGESLYHAAYAESPECVRILLEHGATVYGSNALGAAIDADHVEHVRLMLESGGDANDGALLVHAVRRGCGPEMLRLLAAHGAELDREGGETWRGDVPLRTAHAHAVLRGRTDLAELLAGLGASTELDEGDRWVARLARGERPVGDPPPSFDVDMQEVVILTAIRGDTDLVVDAVGTEFAGVVGGSPEGMLLHHACWMGDAGAVGRLLARGADPVARSPADGATPLEWTVHASQYHRVPGRDFVGVAERLVAAGAPVQVRRPEAAEGPLADWLHSRSIASPKE